MIAMLASRIGIRDGLAERRPGAVSISISAVEAKLLQEVLVAMQAILLARPAMAWCGIGLEVIGCSMSTMATCPSIATLDSTTGALGGLRPKRTGAATMWGTHAAELSTARFSNMRKDTKSMQHHC